MRHVPGRIVTTVPALGLVACLLGIAPGPASAAQNPLRQKMQILAESKKPLPELDVILAGLKSGELSVDWDDSERVVPYTLRNALLDLEYFLLAYSFENELTVDILERTAQVMITLRSRDLQFLLDKFSRYTCEPDGAHHPHAALFFEGFAHAAPAAQVRSFEPLRELDAKCLELHAASFKALSAARDWSDADRAAINALFPD